MTELKPGQVWCHVSMTEWKIKIIKPTKCEKASWYVLNKESTVSVWESTILSYFRLCPETQAIERFNSDLQALLKQ